MARIALLTALDIRCDHPYTISPDTAEQKLRIIRANRLQPAVTVEFFNDRFYLNSSFTNYAAFLSARNQTLIMCSIVDVTEGEEKQRLLRVLRNAFLERAHWKLRYQLIERLSREFLMSEQEIAVESGISLGKIKEHILLPEVPDFYKALAIRTGKGAKVLNRISKDTELSEEQKITLYELAVNEKVKFNDAKYDTLNRYRKRAYYLAHDPEQFKEQLFRIIHYKEYVETVYWEKVSQYYLYKGPKSDFDPYFPMQ